LSLPILKAMTYSGWQTNIQGHSSPNLSRGFTAERLAGQNSRGHDPVN
jgi:hypothetical protein